MCAVALRLQTFDKQRVVAKAAAAAAAANRRKKGVGRILRRARQNNTPIQQRRRRRVKTPRRCRLIFQTAEQALCRARDPVMNYTGAHSLWEIWTVLEVSGGWGVGSSDKLPSLPVSLALLSSLCSRRSSSGEESGDGLFYQVEVILSSVRLFAGEDEGEVVQ